MDAFKIPFSEIAEKGSVKDGVFTDLFSDRRNLLKLYRCLHPEDTATTEDALEYVTVETVVTDSVYNDLAFLVHRPDRTSLIFVEAQSEWSVNVAFRMFVYLSQFPIWYCEQTGQDLDSETPVSLPYMEFYVIYPGERGDKPDRLSFNREFFQGEGTFGDVTARVICAGETDGIIDEYISFCQVMDEQIRKYGAGQKAVSETIRICRERGILKEYLWTRDEGVSRIMAGLFDRENIMESYGKSMAREAAEEAEKNMVERMIRSGKFSLEDIAEVAPSFSLDELRKMKEECEPRE